MPPPPSRWFPRTETHLLTLVREDTHRRIRSVKHTPQYPHLIDLSHDQVAVLCGFLLSVSKSNLQ